MPPDSPASAPRAASILADDVRTWIAARATTRDERIALFAAGGATGDEAALDPSEAAEVVQLWKQAFAGDEAAFARRLSWDGLTPDSAARAVAGVARPPAALIAWTGWLETFAAHAASVLESWNAGALSDAAWPDEADEPPFIELWIAPMRAGRDALSAAASPAARALLSPDATRTLERQLVREITAWAERATFECFRETLGADRYRRFIASQLGAGLLPLWKAFPVLARQTAWIVERWVATTAELLTRLEADRATLAEHFAAGADPGRVESIEPGLSDPHEGRRRVSLLRFTSGLELVYKPRSLGIDVAFAGLLGWAEAHGLPAVPPRLAVLDRGRHGWVGVARHAALASREAGHEYFRKSGALLCLAHALRATDLHMENVIATSSGPVVVDLEPLLQPVKRSDATGLDRAAASTEPHDVPDSCLSSGLLSLYEIGTDGSVFDMGGLRGTGRGTLKLTRRVWQGQRTDDLQYSDVATFTTRTANAAIAGDETLQPDDFAGDVVAGFGETYRWLVAHRDALLAPGGPLDRFATSRTRVIPRSTSQYMMLSAVLAAPRYQRDGATRSVALDVLLRPFATHVERPAVWPALVAERQALEALDVPYFSAGCDDTAVFAGAGGAEAATAAEPLVRGYFSTSGLDGVRARLRAMTDDDALREEDVVARALAESPRVRLTGGGAPMPAPVDDDRARLLDAARWIGLVLAERRRPTTGGVTWRSVRAEARETTTCPHTLYQGTIGTALFFAALYATTNEDRWADIARAAIDPIVDAVASGGLKRWTDGIGVGDGLGSLAYGLTIAGTLLDEPAYVDVAPTVGDAVLNRIETEDQVDALSGLAGGILALLAIHRVRPSERWLSGAKACGWRLLVDLDRENGGTGWRSPDGKVLLGFAHGAAGIAHALDRLADATGEADAQAAAAGARRFVRAQYVPAAANWPIAASATGRATTAPMTAWCHGSPGILLGEVLAAGGLDTSYDWGPALTNVARWTALRSDHLCCGTLGRAEVLLRIGEALGRADCAAAGSALATHVLDRARDAGHFRLGVSEFEYRVTDPGFFRGLSGVGYTLLRLAGGRRLPSILAFETQAPGEVS